MAATESADVVVYGATAGGVMAAISASWEGSSVILVEPGRHVGGMLSGGLGRTFQSENLTTTTLPDSAW